MWKWTCQILGLYLFGCSLPKIQVFKGMELFAVTQLVKMAVTLAIIRAECVVSSQSHLNVGSHEVSHRPVSQSSELIFECELPGT
jgi:spore coat protein U-like protein